MKISSVSVYNAWINNLFLLCGVFFSACGTPAPGQPALIATGADQTALYLPLLEGKAVGLVANHTTVIGKSHLADSLLRLGVKLVRIFVPEHGFRGDADAGEEIGNSIDGKTGLPLISLYGSAYKPKPADLQGIDIMIYDIQDVGVRFYTYISTLHYLMEACSENGISLLVLDRPNPNGHFVDGPLLDTAFTSFVGMHPIPVVYGMTAGELAGMINGEGWLSGGSTCELQVIPCKGYDHNTFYKLPVNPSPNLNSMEAIYLYPSLCFFEGTIMSLGRGTPFPFRLIGHPDYPGHTFSFVPEATRSNRSPVLKDQVCYGIDLTGIPADSLQSLRSVSLKWLIDIYRHMKKGKFFFNDYIDKLAGNGELRKQILAGWTEAQIRESWQDDLREFNNRRKKYLLYNDFISP
ncbi:MAG TPA: DUF1343 domain-containing protein [Bacteroidales bacterium]|nr:DUF1343 domain-containing protein [Bacteroidales bacterium]